MKRSTHYKTLIERIKNKKATIAVIGLGYVGLPLACEFSKAGFSVIGIEINRQKVSELNKGRSYVSDVQSETIDHLMHRQGLLRVTSSYASLKRADAVIICVPTPLRKTKDPDISFIISATHNISKYLKKGQLIVLESTTYPGTTEEVIQPLLEVGNARAGKDFYLCFSPERIDPGNKRYAAGAITKVIGGITEQCARAGELLYAQAIRAVHRVSSARVAEMTKLIENTFRIVNIGLVNELALISNKMGINIWEAINAASTKPFGYMPFYPGPGIGGHCIGIDPLYLSWKARLFGSEIRFIDLARQINENMPEYVIGRISEIFNDIKKSINGARILVIGVAYKKDVSDCRESPALDIIDKLCFRGAHVTYHDPFVRNIKTPYVEKKSAPLNKKTIMNSDLILIVTDHTGIDYDLMMDKAPLIFDTRNVLRSDKKKENVITL